MMSLFFTFCSPTAIIGAQYAHQMLLNLYTWTPLHCLTFPPVLVLSQGLVGHEPLLLPAAPVPACIDASESYYEEAQPYGETFNGKKQNPSQLLPTLETTRHPLSE